MSALIYFEDSGQVVKRFKTISVAKDALTRGRRRGHIFLGHSVYGKMDLDNMAVCSNKYFRREIDYDVVVKNLVSGEDVTIKRSKLSTNKDPSTEHYWTI